MASSGQNLKAFSEPQKEFFLEIKPKSDANFLVKVCHFSEFQLCWNTKRNDSPCCMCNWDDMFRQGCVKIKKNLKRKSVFIISGKSVKIVRRYVIYIRRGRVIAKSPSWPPVRQSTIISAAPWNSILRSFVSKHMYIHPVLQMTR